MSDGPTRVSASGATARPALALLGLLAALVISCSPSVRIHNTTPFLVRAVVSGEGETRNVHLVRSEQAASGDVPEGAYTVTVVPDQAWADAGRAARDALARVLVSPDAMTEAEIDSVVATLDGLAVTLAGLEAAYAGPGQCRGAVPTDGVATVTIALAADGRPAPSCSGTPRR